MATGLKHGENPFTVDTVTGCFFNQTSYERKEVLSLYCFEVKLL